jgi:zeaxanthin glucosyltransferase
MTTALFVLNPATGHINPSLKLAKYLQSKDISCVYVSAVDMQQKIVAEGFEFILMQSLPFGIGLEDGLDWRKKAPYFENLLDRMRGTSYSNRYKEYLKLFEELQPQYLFLDSFFSTDYIVVYHLLKKHHTKLCFLQTMLSPYNDHATPPLTSLLQPTHAGKIKMAWQWHKIKKESQRLFDWLKYLNRSIIKRAMKIHRIDTILVLDKVFHIGFENIPEWVLAPIEFEFRGKTLQPHQQYIGLMTQTTLPMLTDSDAQMVAQIEKAQQHGKKIIYCSLGTLHELHTKGKSIAFFQKLITALGSKPVYKVIISVGKYQKDIFRKLPPHIAVYERVPQTTLLPFCDLFITHGGLNSVLESIWAGVPMLVYPLNSRWDQKGNATRVVYHGLGMVGSLQDNKQTIDHAIHQLLKNESYKKKSKDISQQMQEKYGDENFLEKYCPLNF